MYSRLQNLNSLCVRRRCEVEEIKRNNKKLEYFQMRLNNASQATKNLENYQALLENILKRSKEQDTEYKNNRIDSIEDNVKSGIDVIFPNDDFDVKIRYRNERNKSRSRLQLIDSLGYTRNPRNTEGGLMKQLIGFTSSMGIVTLLNTNKFFIDEAFGAGSPENRSKVGGIIQKYTKKNVQIFLISQNPEVYQDIPRREIHIAREHGETVVKDVFDWGLDE